MNALKEKIYSCSCAKCRAIVHLIEEKGARLNFRPNAAGRLCELAVVAASGTSGILQEKVVIERRAYASHLDITLSGLISDSDRPLHIEHAITNSNHNPSASNRINLGQACASASDGRFYLV